MREKVTTFLKLTGLDKFPDVIADGFTEQIRSHFITEDGVELPEEMQKAVELMQGATQERKPALYEEMISIYAKAFSDEELDQLVAFYSSSAGQRVVALGGIALPELAQAGDVWTVEVMKSTGDALSKLMGAGVAPAEMPETNALTPSVP
jgi:hypothetical protein